MFTFYDVLSVRVALEHSEVTLKSGPLNPSLCYYPRIKVLTLEQAKKLDRLWLPESWNGGPTKTASERLADGVVYIRTEGVWDDTERDDEGWLRSSQPLTPDHLAAAHRIVDVEVEHSPWYGKKELSNWAKKVSKLKF